MARIRSEVQVQFSTDFAILNFGQEPGLDLLSGPFAASEPGGVAMRAGTKYADLDVRVECWDAQPPPADELWEDRDVLPWRSVGGPPVASLSGFEGVDGAEVSLTGLDQARVEILAWGRNRYHYSSGPADDDDTWDQIPLERWLLRLWPDPVGLSAMAGPPRQLIGRSWLPAPTSGLHSAAASLRTSGWSSALGDPFNSIVQALMYRGAAFGIEDPPPPFLPWTWETPVRGGLDAYLDARRERVARAADVDIQTYRDALRALIALGVFATVQTPRGNVLVPNPAPPVSPWDIVEPSETAGHASPRALEFEAYRTVSEDLKHLAGWATDGILRAPLERIATRLGISCRDVVGALSFLAALGHHVDPLPGPDTHWNTTITYSAKAATDAS